MEQISEPVKQPSEQSVAENTETASAVKTALDDDASQGEEAPNGDEDEKRDEDDDKDAEEAQGAPAIDKSSHSARAHKWKEQLQFEQALSECVTISKSKIAIVTQLSCRYLLRYKDIVHLIEKAVRKMKTENNTKLPQLYIIDSVCRAEIREKNQKKFIGRFGRNILKTFTALCRGPETDKMKIKTVFTLWHKEKWFNSNKDWKTIMATMQKWRGDSDTKHSEKAMDNQSPSRSKKKREKKHRHSKKKHRKHRKSKSKHHHDHEGDGAGGEATGSMVGIATGGGGGMNSQQAIVIEDSNNDSGNNPLLASLRSLTKQANPPLTPGHAEGSGLPLKEEPLGTPKRQLEGNGNFHDPDAKRMKMESHPNGQCDAPQHHPSSASASATTSASISVSVSTSAEAQPPQQTAEYLQHQQVAPSAQHHLPPHLAPPNTMQQHPQMHQTMGQ